MSHASTIVARTAGVDRNPSKTFVIAAGVLTGIGLAWAYAPSFAGLIDRWRRDDNYTHGFFVLPIAIAILWQRRSKLDDAAIAPSWWGLAPLAVLLAGRAWLFEQNEQWFESATIPLAATFTAIAVGGRGMLRWAWPALAFSCFMIPLPPRFNTLLAGPLHQVGHGGVHHVDAAS